VYADPEKSETIIGSVTQSEEMEVLETAAEGFMTRKVMAARKPLLSARQLSPCPLPTVLIR
jgi:N-acetylglutamate kinase (EC 2.7.2.8)/N2-acetyl-L-aminoadipate kinase (EC 2.7.2.-)